MDADRMDYLLRDSLHIGVDYGKYDWRRLLNTVQFVEMSTSDGRSGAAPTFRLGVSEGGTHAAEALVLARYHMFTQVYFHKTRVAYDLHYREALKEILENQTFPPPTQDGIREYLKWDDWRVLGLLADENKGKEHCKRIRERDHYREVYHTPLRALAGDTLTLKLIKGQLKELVASEESSRTSTYKIDNLDVPVVSEDDVQSVRSLSDYSPIVLSLNQNPISLTRLYAKPHDTQTARAKVADLLKDARA